MVSASRVLGETIMTRHGNLWKCEKPLNLVIKEKIMLEENQKKSPLQDFETKSPWVNWSDSVRELFKQDPDITRMTWSDDTLELHIYVLNPLKRLAIRELLPEEKIFDKTKVKVFVEQANRRGGDNYIPEIIEAAFEGNPLYCYKHTWNDPEATNCPFTWIEMAKDIIQYPSDNLHALYGDRTVLPAELAEEILGDKVKYIFFDTINPDRPPVPDGEGGHGPFGD